MDTAPQFKDLTTDRDQLPPEYSWLDGGQNYVVCAYYTPDYLPHAIRLKRSLDALRINHCLIRFERVADWAAGTRIKPEFLEDCLARLYPRHVLYVDADAEVREIPTALDDVTSDVGTCFVPTEKHVRIAAGTIYVRNTEKGRRFLANWRSEGNSTSKPGTDSEAMHKVFQKTPGLTITVLPPRYFGMEGEAGVVVEHFTVNHKRSKARKRMRRRIRGLTAITGLLALCFLGWYLLPGLK